MRETIKDANCKFNVAFALALSVKNSLHNIDVFISNQLPNDELPALENISTRGILTKNLNTMHLTIKFVFECESSEKL